MPDGERPSADLPVAEPTEVESRGTRSRGRRSVVVAVVAVIAVAALAVPIALRSSGPSPTHRDARRTTKHVSSRQARIAVGAALAATVAAPSYHASSVMDVTPAPGGGPTRGLVIAAEATINRNPPAMYALATVGGLGKIQSWTDGTRQWEQGGGNYGMTRGGAGPGRPISTFAGLVLGSLGPREGNVAMMSLASPSGYFDIADGAVTAASQVGTTSSNGVQLTEYDVTIDVAQMRTLPGMTSEQKTTAATAFAGLQQEGYARTTVRLGVDGEGYVRAAHMVWTFADGGAVVNDATYSNFGCAGTVTLPGEVAAAPPVPTCKAA